MGVLICAQVLIMYCIHHHGQVALIQASDIPEDPVSFVIFDGPRNVVVIVLLPLSAFLPPKE